MGAWVRLWATILVASLGWSSSAVADAIADFYSQKTIDFIVVFNSGGSYDFYARLLAAHLSRHIPGNPKIVIQFMPGASGMTGAAHLYTRAAQDGSVIGMVAREIAVTQVLNPDAAKIDASKFQWIGSVSSYSGVFFVSSRKNARTVDDLRRTPVIVGSWGKGTSSYTLPMLLNALAGTQFKVVTGYGGGAEVDLAIERGESDARLTSWSSLRLEKQQWLAENKVTLLFQTGVKPNPDLPGIPLVKDLATSDEGRRILAFADSDSGVGWSVAGPPRMPTERVDALRRAFDKTVVDPAFVADAKAKKLDIVPNSGEELDAIVRRTLAVSKTDVDAMNRIIDAKN